MTDAARPDETYTHGHHASVVGQHQRRTAGEAAAFLLPELTSTDRVLDFGCGPGTITAGLARVAGSVVGLDVVPEVLRVARDHTAEQRATNAQFANASVYALPFAGESFDVAYAHQVLQHLADPVAALREAGRVLRSGGVVAVRDVDYATMTWWPDDERLTRFIEVYTAVAARNGGDANAGRRIPTWLRDAGYVDLAISSSTWTFADRDSLLNWGDSWADRVTQSAIGEKAIEYGLATAEELAEIATGWREWARDPEAFFTFLHVEGLGRKP
ncbi:MAG TPA: methyltransferase domain-containing protein [Dehalococcoidia bacterium]|nr:methyltransferase domain-containing protein [Dehalococcoidia bacterium]